MNSEGFRRTLEQRARRVELAAQGWLPAAETSPQRLHQAMRYAVLGGGKRLRPQLVYAAGKALGIAEQRLDGPAAALELIHAYSLIHDDLPAMDDDDLRRGRPTVHKAFDEATAVLAGDALQPLAFEVLAHDEAMQATAVQRLHMIRRLSLAAGSRGMVGGQAMDLDQVGQAPELRVIDTMHRLKTGQLIEAAVLLPTALLSPPDAAAASALETYGQCIGLAFQIHDDVLDEVGDSAVLGKTAGADLARDKPTYPAMMGLDASRKRAAELVESALDSLTLFAENADDLRALAQHVITREK